MNSHELGTILVLGCEGQVGRELTQLFEGDLNFAFYGTTLDPTVVSPRIQFLDVTDHRKLLGTLDRISPKVIVNATAYTAVDRAEEERRLAFQVNDEAVRILAEYCSAHDITLIHYSTDYVFSGKGTQPFKESDSAGPLNQYGKSKLQGEQAILEAGGHAYILRTSWVFSAHGHNFVKTMLKLGAERQQLSVVGDQVGAPTSAPVLARLTHKLAHLVMQGGREFLEETRGVYHLTCRGETSWWGFAQEIFQQARAKGLPLVVEEVLSVPSSEYKTKAERPHNSRLSIEKWVGTFGVQPGHWQDALSEVLDDLLAR